jgi:serine/threonine protein kinase/Flp pilus assembly protein TadD
MEYINGQSLKKYLSLVRPRKLPIEVSLAIIRQVALGIRAAHNKGITHRDLKPDNIILTKDDDGYLLVKVVDFGMAKLKEKAFADTTLTDPGTIIGTLSYMSPEQCQGAEIDARSDIYSLGIIFFELVAGHRPFYASNMTALAVKQVSAPPPRLNDHRPEAPPEIVRLIERSLEKDPALRPQTLSDFLSLLPKAERCITLPLPADAGTHRFSDSYIDEQRGLIDNDAEETLSQRRGLQSIAAEATEKHVAIPDIEGVTDNVLNNEATEFDDHLHYVSEAESIRDSGRVADGFESAYQKVESFPDQRALGQGDNLGITRVNESNDSSGAESAGNLSTASLQSSKSDHKSAKALTKTHPLRLGISLSLAIVIGFLFYKTIFFVQLGYHSHYGDRYLKNTEYQQAIDEYSKALRFDATNEEIYRSRGTAYIRINDLEKALADYNQAIQLNQRYAGAYQLRGEVFERLKDYQRALSDYTEAIKLGGSAEMFIKRANLYNQLNKYDEAIADYSSAIQLKPNDHTSYFGRGLAYLNKGMYDQSINNFARAIELNPSYSDSFNNRGIAYANLRDFSRALADYNEAIRLDPGNARAYGNRGNVHFSQNNYEQALEDYNKALQLMPLVNVYRSRAVLYSKIGKDDLANADLARARQLQD